MCVQVKWSLSVRYETWERHSCTQNTKSSRRENKMCISCLFFTWIPSVMTHAHSFSCLWYSVGITFAFRDKVLSLTLQQKGWDMIWLFYPESVGSNNSHSISFFLPLFLSQLQNTRMTSLFSVDEKHLQILKGIWDMDFLQIITTMWHTFPMTLWDSLRLSCRIAWQKNGNGAAWMP